MKNLSASAVPRLLACAASAVLPQTPYSTSYAEAGKARHLDMEVAVDLGDIAGLPEEIQRVIRPSDKLLAEHSFAIDVSTGIARYLGRVPNREYHKVVPRLGPFEIPGTLDLLIIGTDRLIVVDRKSFEEVEPADRNTQTLTYAVSVARYYGLDEVTVVIIYEFRRPSIATLDVLDLDAHAERLKKLYGDVARAKIEPNKYLATGSHCKYCEAFHDCPRQKALAVDAETGLIALRVGQTLPLNDDAEAAWAIDLLAELKRLSTRLHAAIETRAKARPIPLATGKMFGPRDKFGNEKIDGNVLYDVMLAKHGKALAELAAPRKATKKALREALEFAGAESSLDEAERALLAEVKARGGLKRDVKTTVEEYEPGPRLVASGG